jgi:hypothetical protein
MVRTAAQLPEFITEAQVAWLAGLLEGEGSFIVSPSRSGKGLPAIKCNMTDEDIVRRCQAYTGCGAISGPHPGRSRDGGQAKPSWHWQVGSKGEVKAICEAILPWMGNRRTRAILAVLAVCDYEADEPTCRNGHPRADVVRGPDGKPFCRACRQGQWERRKARLLTHKRDGR